MQIGEPWKNFYAAQTVAAAHARGTGQPVWVSSVLGGDEGTEEIVTLYTITTHRPDDPGLNFYRYDPDSAKTLEENP